MGGGGGGQMKNGLEVARLALEVGEPTLLSINEVQDDATLVTVSAVGSQVSKGMFLKPMHYVRAATLLAESGDVAIEGFIASENGAIGSVNGWFQSAVLGVPVVDAPCNGRAHPTGVMGSMGLDGVKGFVSLQAAAGGNPATGNYVEMFIEASLEKAASTVRYLSSAAGGMVGVARNPIEAAYVRENGAPGAIQQAIEVGKVIQRSRAKGAESVVEAVADALHGVVAVEGTVEEVALETRGGFDVGLISVAGAGKRCELTFWNEYMTLELGGKRVATFPDFMATFSLESGLPLISGEVARGQKIAVLYAPKESLRLGAGMRNPALFRQVEDVVKKPLVKYVFGRNSV